jgi:hypothetical protein
MSLRILVFKYNKRFARIIYKVNKATISLLEGYKMKKIDDTICLYYDFGRFIFNWLFW